MSDIERRHRKHNKTSHEVHTELVPFGIRLRRGYTYTRYIISRIFNREGQSKLEDLRGKYYDGDIGGKNDGGTSNKER